MAELTELRRPCSADSTRLGAHAALMKVVQDGDECAVAALLESGRRFVAMEGVGVIQTPLSIF